MEENKIERIVFSTREDWLTFRKDLFTSSQINRLMADPTKKEKELGEVLSKGAITYILERISGVEAEPKTQYYSPSMEWGNEQEPQAVLLLADLFGKEVSDSDFIYTSSGGYVFFIYDKKSGGTPDVIMSDAIAEIKCPDSHTHLYYKLFVNEDNIETKLPDYYDQMQHNMMLCGKDKCYFFSYDPRFKKASTRYHLVEVKKNEDRCRDIISKIEQAHIYKNELLNKLL